MRRADRRQEKHMHRSGVCLVVQARLSVMRKIMMETAHSENLATIVDMKALD
jgi:hypothetical protein